MRAAPLSECAARIRASSVFAAPAIAAAAAHGAAQGGAKGKGEGKPAAEPAVAAV